MKRAAVRLGRIHELGQEIAPGRLSYDRGGMKLARKDTPLIVDHDETRRIGRVLELYEWPDTTATWLTASVELDPAAPTWIRKGTRASFGSVYRSESSFVEGLILTGFVLEVSVLLDQAPAEPGARVMMVYDGEPAAPKATVIEPVYMPAPRLSSRHQRELAELNRRIDAAGPNADIEAIMVNLKAELGYYQRPWTLAVA